MAWLKIHIKRGLVCLVVLLNMILAGGTNPVLAGEDPDDLFNYSFGVWLGSGVYKVNDANKKFAVLRVPAAYTLRPVQSDQSAPIDRLGFRLLRPQLTGWDSVCCCRPLSVTSKKPTPTLIMEPWPLYPVSKCRSRSINTGVPLLKSKRFTMICACAI